MDNHLYLSDSCEPRFEWPAMLPSPSTATTASLSPDKESNINTRVNNLELLVSNLMTRIIELEKNNSDLQINTTYNWSTATKNNLLHKNLTRSRSNLVDYFARYASTSKSI